MKEVQIDAFRTALATVIVLTVLSPSEKVTAQENPEGRSLGPPEWAYALDDEVVEPVGGESLETANVRDGLLRGTRLRTEHSLAPLAALAAELSTRPGWLSAPALKALKRRGVAVSELFEGAPEILMIEGRWYRLTLVADGPWSAAKRAEKSIVVIDPEVHYDLDRPSQVLFFAEGAAFYGSLGLLAEEPVIVLSLEELATDIQPRGARMHYPVDLVLGPFRGVEGLTRSPGAGALLSKSLTDTPPTCSLGRLSCGGGTAYFYLDELMILQDQETVGSPEVEAEIHRVDYTAPSHTFLDPILGIDDKCDQAFYPFHCNHWGPANRFIFDGNVHKDALGRDLKFNDVNSKNVWYNFSPAIALFPVTGGFSTHPEYGLSGGTLCCFSSSGQALWSVNLIEDDSEAGTLKIDQARLANTRVYHWPRGATKPVTASTETRFVDQFALWRLEKEPAHGNDPGSPSTYLHDYSSTVGIDLNPLLNPDDPYETSNNSGRMEGIGISENLFNTAVCSNGQPANTSLELTAGEFKLRGHFGCPCNGDCEPPDDPTPPPPSCANFDYSQCIPFQTCQSFCLIGDFSPIGHPCCGCTCNGFDECPLCLDPGFE